MCLRLDAFARAVRAEQGDRNRDMWIALAVLRKRAFSSAHALYLSVTRRLDWLAGIAPSPTQMVLPLDDYGESTDADDTPAWRPVLGLRDVDHERRLLTDLADAAQTCAQSESKVRVVGGYLAHFQADHHLYRAHDTLAIAAINERAVLLHGGLSRIERTAALASFASGTTRILLATDAAAEGLNLHHACRTVVNLELPWNPMRLEQRIGRVDRIGQRKTVHAFHLVGADTGELRLLDDLRERIADARWRAGSTRRRVEYTGARAHSIRPDGRDSRVDADSPVARAAGSHRPKRQAPRHSRSKPSHSSAAWRRGAPALGMRHRRRP
jgi:hypothetical protein